MVEGIRPKSVQKLLLYPALPLVYGSHKKHFVTVIIINRFRAICVPLCSMERASLTTILRFIVHIFPIPFFQRLWTLLESCCEVKTFQNWVHLTTLWMKLEKQCFVDWILFALNVQQSKLRGNRCNYFYVKILWALIRCYTSPLWSLYHKQKKITYVS